MSKLLKRLLLGSMLTLSALLPINAIAGETLQRVTDFQTLTVGMAADFPPMVMVDKTGTPMGFDVDVARALANAMKVKLEVKGMPFDQLLGAVEDGTVDMVISNMSITPQRTELVSFIGPYMMSGKSLLTKDSVLGKVSETEQFNRKDLKLMAVSGTTSVAYVKSVAPEATLVEIGNYSEGVSMLLEGKADALVGDMPMCVMAVARNPGAGLLTLKKPLTVEPLGIAVSKDDPQFFNLVDNYLRAYEKTGTLGQIRKKWFEDMSWVTRLP